MPRIVRFTLVTLVACTLYFAADSAGAVPITGFAAMGASETQGTAYNGSWVPYLAVDRGIYFGSGQSFNRAVGGSTTTTLLSGGQHTQVANLVQNSNVNMVSIFIGGLDVPELLLGNQTVEAWANGVTSRITTAIDTVLAKGPDGMLVWGIPDMTLVPQGQSSGLPPDALAAIVAAIDLVNGQIKSVALARHLVFIDTAQALRDINAAPLIIGGVTINTSQGNSNPRYFFQDGLHPAVVGNGVFANMALTALDIGYGQNYALFTDQTLLQKAGLSSSYIGHPTSHLPYSNYVYYNAVPEPSTIVLFGGGLLGVAVAGCRRAKRRTAAARLTT